VSISRFRVVCGGVVCGAVLALGACGGSGDANGDAAAAGRGAGGGDGGRAIPVAARIAQPVELEVVLRGSANLRAREQVEVLPKQTGVIARVMVEEGASVRAGQPLAVLDAEEWRLQARQADARARAAQDALERGRALASQGMLAEQEMERLRSESAVAAADRDLAQLRVRNATITAPIGGVVTHRYVERGQLVNNSTRAFAVADVSRLEADVGVPERDAARVRTGQTARIRIEGLGATVQGRVARVRPVVDPGSGTVQVTVEVNPQQAGGLRAGQFVNVTSSPKLWTSGSRCHERPCWSTAPRRACSSWRAVAPRNARSRSAPARATRSRSAAVSNRATRWSSWGRTTCAPGSRYGSWRWTAWRSSSRPRPRPPMRPPARGGAGRAAGGPPRAGEVGK